jgi:hypothetical protein
VSQKVQVYLQFCLAKHRRPEQHQSNFFSAVLEAGIADRRWKCRCGLFLNFFLLNITQFILFAFTRVSNLGLL